MIWNFVKMHGAGNDFVVLDGVRQSIQMRPQRARALEDRHFGVGADQLLLVENPLHPEDDFRYRIFNADGSEVAEDPDRSEEHATELQSLIRISDAVFCLKK